MKMPLFTGVCTALVTPFKDNCINYTALDHLLERQINSGVKAIVLSGTTGESPALSDDEKTELIYHTKNLTGNDCLIIAGTGSNSTDHTISLSKNALYAGADGILVVSPYYNKGNVDGLYRHYAAIAESVDLPMILYNVPSRTGMDIPIEVYKKLSEKENIVGVKEATADITKTINIRNSCPDDFYFWSGNDDQIVPVISTGGQGVISVLSNIKPKETIMMTESAMHGDYKTASKIQAEMMPLIKALFSEVNPIPVKYALKLTGIDCGECRLPLGHLSPKNQSTLESLLI